MLSVREKKVGFVPLIIGIALIVSVRGDPCSFSTQNNYSKADLDACFDTIPANDTVIQQTIDLLDFMVDQYSYTAISAYAGPPYDFRVNLGGSLLAMRNTNLYTRDLDFQDKVGMLFQSLHDGHTQYQKPACYNFMMIQALNPAVTSDDKGVQRVKFETLYVFGVDVTAEFGLDQYVGAEILQIDGQVAVAAMSAGGDASSASTLSQDEGVRFTEVSAGFGFVARSLLTASFPASSSVTYTLLLDDGSVTDVSIPWRFIPSNNVTNTTEFQALCAPTPVVNITCNTTSDVARSTTATSDAHRFKFKLPKRHGSAGWSHDVFARVEDKRVDSLRALKSGLGANSPKHWHKRVLRGDGGGGGGELLLDFLDHPKTASILTEDELNRLNRAKLGIHEHIDSGFMEAIEEKYSTLGFGLYAKRMDATPSNHNRASSFLRRSKIAHVMDTSSYASGRPPLLLKISTFDPPELGQCQAILGPCPTPEQEEEYLECYLGVLSEILTAYHKARDAVTSGAYSSLILDLSANGGGSVALATYTAVVLQPSMAEKDPWNVFAPYDFAYSQAMAEMLTFAQNNNLSTQFPYGGYDYTTHEETTGEWFRASRTMSRGRSQRAFTGLFHVVSGEEIQEIVNDAPGASLTNQTLTILTDGRCGSACAQFLHSFLARRSAVVVQTGGLSRVSSDTKSFPGGFIFNNGDKSISGTYNALKEQGFSFSPGIKPPVDMPTSAMLTMNWAEAYSLNEAPMPGQNPNVTFQTPLQFFRQPANSRVPYWGYPLNFDLPAAVEAAAASVRPQPPPVCDSGAASAHTAVALFAALAFVSAVVTLWRPL